MAVVIDFETKELDIGLFGPGWAFGGVKPLCCSVVEINKPYLISFGEQVPWGTENKQCYQLINQHTINNQIKEFKKRLDNESTLIQHNSPYDFGILAMMYGIDFLKNKTLIDTKMLIYFYNTTLDNTLNGGLKHFFNEEKSDKPLALYSLRHRLFNVGFKQRPALQKARNKWKLLEGKKSNWVPPKCPVRTKDNKIKLIKAATSWVKSNMDTMYYKCPDLLEQYCIDDSIGEAKIYNKLIQGMPKFWIDVLSDLQKGLIRSRIGGVRTDNKAIQHARDVCFMKEELSKQAVFKDLGYEVLLTSPQQLSKALIKLGYKPEMNTETKNYSVDHAWLQAQYEKTNDVILKNILLFRKYYVARNHFCDKLIKMNELLGTWDQPFGRIYPEIKPFGADASGRFSSAHPNIQQIPSIDKDKEIGTLLRSCFLPEEGETWYTLDWKAQEPRLQAYFAKIEGIESAENLVSMWKADPNMDCYMAVAQIVYPEITEEEELKKKRKLIKVIFLGLSYGMGKTKLYDLHLKVNWAEGESIYNNFDSKTPYLRLASKAAMEKMKNEGYIETLLGRKIYCPPPYYDKFKREWRDLSYKAFSFKVQGSGADMCIFALSMAEKMGIKILFPVHDELNISTSNIDTVRQLKYIMEKGIPIEVPMVVEIGAGKSWADACENEIEL